MRFSRLLVTVVVSGLAIFVGSAQVAHGATLTVDSTADTSDFSTADGVCDTDDSVGDGPCTLRAAIEQANFDLGTDTIVFSIAGPGTHTISPGSALPTITDPVIIDGTSEPDFAGTPIVELDGTSAGNADGGLNITAGSSTVKGLVINRFSGNGIFITSGGGNKIEGNYIGTDATGTADLGNSDAGVFVFDSSSNTIGGTASGAGNVISGNNGSGVEIFFGAAENKVEGNYIGTDASGAAALGNSSAGVFIADSPSNTIGGTASGVGNVISGNNGSGIIINGETGNKVEGNYIGTDSSGAVALGNSDAGVFVFDSSSNTIGGTTSGAGNVISGNGSGIIIGEDGATGNKIEGNYIGTDASGIAALGNSDGGVLVLGSPSNTIGGTTSGARNVISGNSGSGVEIFFGAAGNTVSGNYIGTDATGTAALGNSLAGVFISDAPSSNTIGGTTSGAGNVISGNLFGVVLEGAGNKVEGNYIGTDAAGSAALGNGYGVAINAPSNTIGGTASGAGNVISGNSSFGVIMELAATGNKVEGNYIGTDATGSAALGNNDHGVLISAPSNTIGGTASGARNVISGNNGHGIIIENAATGTKVEGNYIGTDATGSAALGNSDAGVYVQAAASNTIGGTTSGARNVISGNQFGIMIANGATGNKIESNYIGTDAAGSAALGNSALGLAIQNAPSNTVGGPAAGNVISGNGGPGVSILSGTGNTITENSIYSNDGLGIDNDVGGNAELTPPTVTAAGSASGSSDCASCTIEVFSDDDDEGETFHGTATTAAGPCPCAWSFPGAVIGPNITATVTDASGNTSEFSAPFVADADGDGQLDAVDACPNTPTAWLTPIGDTDCDGFTSADEGSIGTDPNVACGANAWPPDFDDNQVINTVDVFFVLPPFYGTTVPPTDVRRDLVPDGVINTVDVSRVLPPFFGSRCTP